MPLRQARVFPKTAAGFPQTTDLLNNEYSTNKTRKRTKNCRCVCVPHDDGKTRARNFPQSLGKQKSACLLTTTSPLDKCYKSLSEIHTFVTELYTTINIAKLMRRCRDILQTSVSNIANKQERNGDFRLQQKVTT